MNLIPLVDHAADLIEQADALVVAAGAGMGVDSGLPDFRGRQGFWRAYPALGRAGLDFPQVASPRQFDRDPALAWGFYGHRLALYRSTVPHRGFDILARWAQQRLQGGCVFTSNVDGQFQRAGWSPQTLHECHGSIHHLQCSVPCGPHLWPADDLVPEIDADACRWQSALPRCPACGALARPNILMFNDSGWIEHRAAQQAARQATWLHRVERPVVIEIGAGSAVPSVRHFTQRLLHDHGARLVRINPSDSDVPPGFGVGLPMPALQALRAIETRMGGPA